MLLRYVTTGDIFTTYKNKYPEEFSLIFGVDDEENTTFLDDFFMSLYANKTISSIIHNKIELMNTEELTPEQKQYITNYIVSLIHLKKENVIELKNIANTQYDFKNTYTETITETITENRETRTENNIENTENTYGFNSNDKTPENNTIGSDTGHNTQSLDNTKNNVKTVSDKPIQDLIDKETKRLVSKDIIRLIFNCYADILFIQLYE